MDDTLRRLSLVRTYDWSDFVTKAIGVDITDYGVRRPLTDAIQERLQNFHDPDLHHSRAVEFYDVCVYSTRAVGSPHVLTFAVVMRIDEDSWRVRECEWDRSNSHYGFSTTAHSLNAAREALDMMLSDQPHATHHRILHIRGRCPLAQPLPIA